MNDLISRQKAINTANRMYQACDTNDIVDYYIMMCEALEALPSAQPTQEIIHCKDCRFWKKYKYFNGKPTYAPFCGFNSIFTDDNDFCSRAEKRGEADG